MGKCQSKGVQNVETTREIVQHVKCDVHALKAATERINSKVSQVGNNVNEIKSSVDELKGTAAQIGSEVSQVRKVADGIKSSVNELKDTTAQIGSEVSLINYNVNGIKHSLNGLVQDVNGVKTDIKMLKFDVSEIKDTVGNINLISVQVLGIVEKNLAALSRNFDAIQNVERRLNQTFAITQAHMNVLETKIDVALASIEDAKNIIIDKISRAELNILDQLKRDKINSIKSKLITFANYFQAERDNMSKLSLEVKIEMLTNPQGIMRNLLDSRTPQPHSLYSLLSDIINQDMAIPVDSNDEIAVVALDILLYGLQVYSLIVLFLVENYSLLADASYQKSDLKQFNSYISAGVRDFNSFSYTLKYFVKKISNVIDTVKSKEFIQIERRDVVDFISIMSEVMRVIESGLKDIEQLLPVEIHKNRYLILEKPYFAKQSNIATPSGLWKDGRLVSYAIQFRNYSFFTYSKVGDWSFPFEIQGSANPVIKLPDASAGKQTRLIFRRFGSNSEISLIPVFSTPELVATITNGDQVEFRDINREVFNAASKSHEGGAIASIEMYVKNGADVNAEFEQGKVPLHVAAKHNNLKIALTLLKFGAVVNAKDVNGLTAMHIAADAGFDDFVIELLNYKADINERNNLGQTPLHIAAYQNRHSLLGKLLKNDQVKVNAKTMDGFTPLHAAAVTGNGEIVELLVRDKRININAITNLKYTSIHLAAMFNFHAVIKVLINAVHKELDVNAKAVDDITPLHLAAASGSLNVVQQLLSHSAIDVNVKQVDGLTPLHLAIKYEKFDVAFELLKRANIDVNIQGGSDRLTPLHLAAIKGNEQILVGLLKKGAKLELLAANDLSALHFAVANAKTKVMLKLLDISNLKAKTAEGALPLHLAAFSGHEDITKRLVDSSIDFIDIKDRNEYTPLYVAFKYNNTKVAQELLDYDANIRLRLSDFKSLLHFASKNGDPNAVTNLLEYGVNVNSADSNYVSPLHYATQNGHTDIVRILLDQGANTNALDRSNMTPLHYIAKLDSHVALEMAGILVRKSANINAYNKDSFTMLHIAAQNGNYRLIKFLIENKADVNFSIDNSPTPLHVAAENNRYDIVKLLLNSGANVKAKTGTNVTPLHAAIKGKGEYKVIKLLADKGSNINTVDLSGSNLVDDAVVAGKMDVVLFLIDKSVDMNLLKKDEWTLLHYAAREGNLRLVKLLLKMGSREASNLNAKNRNWQTPLQVAIKGKGNLELVKYMVRMGADYSNRDKQDRTLVLEAVLESKVDIAQFLVEKGADLNLSDSLGLTPLHIAAFDGNYDLTVWLLDNFANIDARSGEGQSPLHVAIKGKGNLKLIQLFAKKSANLKTQDKHSVSLAHEAVAQNKMEIATFLIKHGVDFNTQTDTGDSVMHYAAKNGNIQMVEYLIEKAANINVINREGRTPLHVTIREKGDLDLVQLLVNSGAYLDLKDTAQYTLLDEAIEKGKIDIAQFLILQKVEVRHLTKNGWTLLHHAAKQGMLELVKFMVQNKVEMIDSKNELGETPLMIAVKDKGNLDMVEYLIDNGANKSITNNAGQTLLHEAALYDKLEIAKRLVTLDLRSINSVDSMGYTPIHSAASVDNLEIFKFLFEIHEDSFAPTSTGLSTVELAKQNDAKQIVHFLIIARDKSGKTMLHRMAENGDLKMVNFLLDNGAIVDELSSDKMAALHLAAMNGHLNVVRYLAGEKCSNPELKNGNNQSALNLAKQYSHYSIVEYFSNNDNLNNAIKRNNIDFVRKYTNEGGAIKCPIGDKGWTALHLAAFNGQLDIVNFLIEQGVSLNVLTSDGKSPLELAQKQSKSNVVKALTGYTSLLIQAINENSLDRVKQRIKEGADVNMKSDEKGNTALHVAAEGGKLEIVKYLVMHCGANIHAETNAKQIPLELAMLQMHKPVVNYLMERTRVELYDAITNNNMQKVRLHLRGWDIVNGNDTNSWTALHVAAHHGYPQIVKYLLENGASCNVKNAYGSTPLDLARKRGKREVVRSLINTVNNQGSFMLHEAAGRGDLTNVHLLIENNAAVDAKNTKGETPAQVAVKNSGSLEIVQLLVNSGADINTKDQNGISLVFNTIIMGKIDIVKYLIEKGADINAADNDGWTPLHEAVMKGNFKLTKYLLLQNTTMVKVDAKNNDGKTALHLMINEKSSLNMALLLVQCGADVKSKDNRNNSLVLQAIVKNRLDIAEFFISEGADLHSSNNDGWTPLHEAAKRDNVELIQLLLKHGAQLDAKTKDQETPLEIADMYTKINSISLFVNYKDTQGQTMLHHAARKGEFSDVRFLLDKRSHVNAVDKLGNMPIHLAAQSGHPVVASALVDNGANFCVKNSLGFTPLEIAHKHNDAKMISFLQSQAMIPLVNLMTLENNSVDKIKDLISKGANINCVNEDNGWTALHYAAHFGKVEVAKLLIQSGANTTALSKEKSHSVTALQLAIDKNKHQIVVQILINAIDINRDYSPLHIASENGELETVKYLLAKGASLNVPNSKNETALHVAAANNRLDVVKYILEQNSTIQQNLIEVKSVKGETPLNYAINYKGDLKMVELFHKKGANLVSKDLHENTYVLNAVIQRKNNVFNFLIQNGTDLNLPNKDGWTLLHFAALYGNTDAIKSLIEKKAELNYRNGQGKTPLHVAVGGVKSKQVFLATELLINSGAKVNNQDNSGNSIFLESILKGKSAVVQLLDSKGADVNVANMKGSTALHEAAKIGDYGLIQFLLLKNANVDAKDSAERTPLQVLIREPKFVTSISKLRLAKLFIDKGANVHTVDKEGSSLLIDAAKANSQELVQEFVSMNVNVNAPDQNGNTPLHEAARHENSVKLLQYLLFKDTNIEAKNNLGQTPFHVAVCSKSTMDNLVYFFAKGANVRTADNRKSTLILDAAILNKNYIVKLLIEKGAHLNAENSDGFTPLHAAAKNGNSEMVQLLLNNNARVDVKDVKGWTALHYAADDKWLAVVKKLVENGANVEVKDNLGKRPLDLAIDVKKYKIAKFLIAQKDTLVKVLPRTTRSIQVQKLTRNIRDANHSATIDWNKQQTVASSSSKPLSWINIAINSVVDAFKDVSRSVFASEHLPNDNFTNVKSSLGYQSLDLNSSLLLFDVAIRKLTGQQYVATAQNTMFVQDARSKALNIVSKFEKVLSDSFGNSNKDFDKANLDIFELYKSVESLLISGSYSKIPGALFEASKQVIDPKFDNVNESFTTILKESINEMFSDDKLLNNSDEKVDEFTHFITEHLNSLNTNETNIRLGEKIIFKSVK